MAPLAALLLIVPLGLATPAAQSPPASPVTAPKTTANAWRELEGIGAVPLGGSLPDFIEALDAQSTGRARSMRDGSDAALSEVVGSPIMSWRAAPKCRYLGFEVESLAVTAMGNPARINAVSLRLKPPEGQPSPLFDLLAIRLDELLGECQPIDEEGRARRWPTNGGSVSLDARGEITLLDRRLTQDLVVAVNSSRRLMTDATFKRKHEAAKALVESGTSELVPAGMYTSHLNWCESTDSPITRVENREGNTVLTYGCVTRCPGDLWRVILLAIEFRSSDGSAVGVRSWAAFPPAIEAERALP